MEPDLSALEQAAQRMFEEVVGERFTVTVRRNYEARTVELDARTTRSLLGMKKR